MEATIKFCGKTPIRRPIKEWHIDTKDGFIYGVFKPFGLPHELFDKGRIVAFVANCIVVAKSRCNVYAFSLNGINPCYVKKKKEYLKYLKTKALNCSIVF